mmetsp:Transcript_42223/g.97748  ORF Transcript_42223/g.97748 Transcript_42223/m.97748 type:complete len:109 (+) Transcript_42223:2-328(+)
MARLMRKRYSASAAFKHYHVKTVHVRAWLGFKVDVESLVARAALLEGCRVSQVSSQHATVEVDGGEPTKSRVLVRKCGALLGAGKTFEQAHAAMQMLMPVLGMHGVWW